MRKLIYLLLAMCGLLVFNLSSQEVAAVLTQEEMVEGLVGDELLEELAKITFNNHKTYTSYSNLTQMNALSDPDPNNSSRLLDFYSRISVSSAWDQGATWNREHVWPQSLSNGLYGESGPGSDIHHIRPTISSINSSRGNKKFTDFDMVDLTTIDQPEEYRYPKTTGEVCAWENNTCWEPLDNVKGDTARIILYLYMHYSTQVEANKNHSANGYKAGNLALENVIYSDTQDKEGALEILVEWNELDPVDEYEMNRNNYCKSVTQTSNVFIDNPEYVNLIWSDEAYEGRYSVNYETNGASFDYVDNTKYESGSKIKKPTIAPKLENHVFNGWYIDARCTTLWDFNNDVIYEENLKLYAKFTEETFTDIILNSTINSKLSFNIFEEDGGSTVTTGSAIITNPKAGSGTLAKANYNLADYYNFDSSLFDMMYKYNNSGYSYISAGAQIRLYPGNGNGSSIEITAKEGVKITKVTVTSQNNKPVITVASDGKTAKIHNTVLATTGQDNQSRITSFTIEYEIGSSGKVTKVVDGSVKLSYGLLLNQIQYEKYLNAGEVNLYINDELVNYSILKSGDKYYLIYTFTVTDFDEVFIPRFVYLDKELTIDGHSASSLAQVYLADLSSNQIVKTYKSCLEDIIG